MKFLYWTGGIPELESVVSLEKTVNFVEGKPDALILNDLLNQTALLTDPHDQSLFCYAELHFDKMYHRSIPELRQGNRDDWLKGITLSPDDQRLYVAYQRLVEQQHKAAGEQYAHARDVISSIAGTMPVFIVPGRHDTTAIWDAFGERTLHIKATDVAGQAILGLGAIYEHSQDIAESLRIGAFDAGLQYVSPEQLLERNAATDILVVNDFIEKHHDRRLESNKIDPTNKMAKTVNAFVAGDWAKDGLLCKKHKLVITPAGSNAPNSEVSHLHGSVVLNAGLNQAHGFRAYLVDYGEQGVADITALGVGGRQSTPYSYDAIKGFPPISQEDLNVIAPERIAGLEKQLAEERAKNAKLEKKRKTAPKEDMPVPPGTVIGDNIITLELGPLTQAQGSPSVPDPTATPVDARPETDAVPAPKEPAAPNARPSKAKRKAQPEPMPEAQELTPEKQEPVSAPHARKERKPSRFELFVENVWASLEDTVKGPVKKMSEAKQAKQYALYEALYAIKETLLERGKHKERIKALESTVEIVACGLVDKSMDAAEALLTSYVYYLGKIGFAKKHPAEYKQLATLATGLLAKYVNGLKHENRELTKYIAVAKRKYRNAAKLSERAHKQELANLRQKLKEIHKAQIADHGAQLEKYEGELDPEDVYVLEDDTNIKERDTKTRDPVSDLEQQVTRKDAEIKELRQKLTFYEKTDDALECMKDEDYEGAIEIYKNLLGSKDTLPLYSQILVQYQLGNTYLRNADISQSITHFAEAKTLCAQREEISPEDKGKFVRLEESIEFGLNKAQRLSTTMAPRKSGPP